jgi:ectoine hydroxylase-related dioxygenase (phytanoyl-CoA dioxygenase family)
MTAQINLVHPGGAAQQAHWDYHLGFQTAEVSVEYPVHVHDLSPTLTLQGALAHCDMPIESCPTKLLPFS